MAKKLEFHSDQQHVVVFVNGTPVAVSGEVHVTVLEPTKKSRINKTAWALITQENAAAVSCDTVPGA